MLTEVKAYSSWRSAPALPLSEGGRAEYDLIQVRNIDGLDPVKASVNTSPYGSVDGASHVGSSVLTRNIVLTLHPNPDWDLWTYETLRKLLYAYFMPKRATRLVFYSDDMVPVEISGIVEGVEVNMFTKDPEVQVSIVCPDPYFTALNPTVVTGQAIQGGGIGEVSTIEYDGTIETGMQVKVTGLTAPNPTYIGIWTGDNMPYFEAAATVVPETKYFEMSSLPMKKYVQNVEIGSGIITNLLSKVTANSGWPMLQPGENDFCVVTGDSGDQDWELRYFERFGGL
jgi:hypothetical protein